MSPINFLNINFSNGSILSNFLTSYVSMSPVGAFVGASLYSQYGGKQWKFQIVLGSLIFPSVMLAVTSFINIISLSKGVSKYVDLKSMIILGTIYIFGVFPASFVGAILGRKFAGTPNFPCRVSPLPKMIPCKFWYLYSPYLQIFSSLLPLGSIFVEIYFIFSYFWMLQVYYVYQLLFLVFLILVVTTMCVAVVITYLLLNSEDYRWHWSSISVGAGLFLHIMLYSLYYLIFHSNMYGFFQITFYFGYCFAFAFALALICGSLSYLGANLFVHKIYQNIKVE